MQPRRRQAAVLSEPPPTATCASRRTEPSLPHGFC